MDSEDEIEEYQSWRGVPATIVLINAYDYKAKSETVTLSLVATCRMIRQHLRLAKTHHVGVCLYGIESETSSFGQNVIQICPLNPPDLDDFKKLQNVKVDSYKAVKELRLSEALWHCGKMFTNCKKQLLSRTILLLSSLDIAPIESDHRATYMRVSNLVESNIAIKLINISKEHVTINPFYKNFLSEANGGKVVTLPKPLWDHKAIENLMFQQSHRHLALAQLNFEIGNGLAIGVGVYNLLKTSNMSKTEDLHRDTNEILTSVTKTLKVSTEDTNSDAMSINEAESEPKQLPVLKSELLHYVEYGGQRIEFTDKEKKHMSNPFGPPLLKLLGFKPASMMCKEKWFLKSGYFLYPNEGIIEGSTIAFKALHKACLEMSVVAISVLCTRVNSRPFIAALSPCSNPLGLDVEIGFDVIIIPFVEHVRELSVEDDDTNISEPQKVGMKNLINDLVFDYKPDMFENPKDQSKYIAIEAIALADEEMETFVDTTKPDPDKFQNIQDDLFYELFGQFGEGILKRPATNRASNSGSKKSKSDFQIDEELLQQRLNERKVAAYTVEQLKQILKFKNIPDLPAMTGLKKNNLVDLVYSHC